MNRSRPSDRTPSGSAASRFDPSRVAARLIRERELRSRYLPDVFTSGAAWVILLDLFRQEPQRISSVCYGSGEAFTTALRHLTGLETAGLVHRLSCKDKRGSLLRLSPWAREQLTDYLTAIAGEAGTAETGNTDPVRSTSTRAEGIARKDAA